MDSASIMDRDRQYPLALGDSLPCRTTATVRCQLTDAHTTTPVPNSGPFSFSISPCAKSNERIGSPLSAPSSGSISRVAAFGFGRRPRFSLIYDAYPKPTWPRQKILFYSSWPAFRSTNSGVVTFCCPRDFLKSPDWISETRAPVMCLVSRHAASIIGVSDYFGRVIHLVDIDTDGCKQFFFISGVGRTVAFPTKNCIHDNTMRVSDSIIWCDFWCCGFFGRSIALNLADRFSSANGGN